MDESRRRACLSAMGIDLWLPRGAPPDPAPPAAGLPPVAPPASAAHAAAAPPVAAPAVRPSPPANAPVRLPPGSPMGAHPGTARTAPPVPAALPASGPAVWGNGEEPPFPDLDAAWVPVSESAWEPVFEPEWEPGSGPDREPVPAAAVPPARPAAPPAPPAAPRDWDALAAAVAGCRACALATTRTKTVFGVGNREAQLLVIGEAPGADEDRAGEPFVGRAGQLLDRMLAAIGLAREAVYIANILKCRPPHNRNPLPAEVACCQGYLAAQIALIRPRVILCVGAVSAQNLLGTDTPVGKLRGRWFDYGPAAIPLRVTYHPAYLLRSPEQKARAWEDLIAVALKLGENGQSGLS